MYNIKKQTISIEAYKHKFIENVNLTWNEYPKSIRVDIETFMSSHTTCSEICHA